MTQELLCSRGPRFKTEPILLSLLTLSIPESTLTYIIINLYNLTNCKTILQPSSSLARSYVHNVPLTQDMIKNVKIVQRKVRTCKHVVEWTFLKVALTQEQLCSQEPRFKFEMISLISPYTFLSTDRRQL